MITSRTITKVAASALVALAVTVPALPAVAQTATTTARQGATLGYIKTRAKVEVDRREVALTALKTRVDGAKRVTADHRSTLDGQIVAAADGLRSLNAKIQADTDVTTARADAQRIVTDYRVFVLVEPRTHLVIAADIDTAGATRLTAVADKLDAAIAKAQANGKDVTGAKTALADMRSQISAAQAKSTAVPGSVLPLTAAGYPGNKPTLTAARDSLRAAHDELKAAIADARTVIADLK